MQRPPTWAPASSTTTRRPAAISRRAAAIPAAPAPTITTSAGAERDCSERGAPCRGDGAPRAGPAARAAVEAARNVRRVNGFMLTLLPSPTLHHPEASGKQMDVQLVPDDRHRYLCGSCGVHP